MIHPLCTDGNINFSQNPENSKFNFLLSCPSHGWHIFPLHHLNFDASGKPVCSCGGTSACTGAGKHPFGRWSQPLSPTNKRTETVIASHMEKWPDRGWGIHLGLSGLVCVDVDPRNGGLDSLHQLRSCGIIPAQQANVVTGSGGFHFYFLAPPNCDPRRGWAGPNGQTRCSTLLAPGIDFLAGQHFMVLPFSPHASGGSYAWDPAAPILALPSSIADRVNSRPAFEAPSRTSWHGGSIGPSVGRSPGTPSVDAARAYLATMEPAINGKEGSRRTGRVARVLMIDFGLDRADGKILIEEWNRNCSPPWSDAEIERKLDYGEAGHGTRGWRNNARGSTLSHEEKLFEKKFAEVPLNWGRRLLNVKTGEISYVQEKIQEINPDEFFEKEPKQERSSAVPLKEIHSPGKEKSRPTCQNWRHIILKKKGVSEGRVQAFPCRRLDCDGCFACKKQWYIDTQRHHLYHWELDRLDEDWTPVFVATVSAEKWPKIAARLRRKGADFFRLDPYACGDIQGVAFLVVATVACPGPAWEEKSSQAAAILLEDAVNSLPSNLRRRVWWSSRAWKLLRDDPEPEARWERIGKAGAGMPTTRRILESSGVEFWSVFGGGKRWPWHGLQFSFDPDQWERLRIDLAEGDMVSGGVTFKPRGSAAEDEFVPDWLVAPLTG